MKRSEITWPEVDEGDHVEIVHVMTSDNVEAIRRESALEELAGRFEGMEVTIKTHQLNRGASRPKSSLHTPRKSSRIAS